MYKIEISKLIDCSLSDSEANDLTQLAGTLTGQTGPIAFEECAILFSNVPETSIMCADATKKIDFDNMVRYLKNVIIFTPFNNNYRLQSYTSY